MSINPETLAVLRGVAQTIISEDLKTEVTIMRRQRAAETPYGLSDEEFTDGGTYMAWVVDARKFDLDKLGGLAGVIDELEVRLPIEAIVESGDQVIVGGTAFTVQSTNNEHTLPMFMKAWIRRVA